MSFKIISDKDVGFVAFIKGLKALKKEPRVKVGIQGAEADKIHPGGISMLKLGAVHEFGARIRHPGGTPYMIVEGGLARFLPKGDPRAIGVTRPHIIEIPQRSFLRATADANKQKYERRLVNSIRKLVRTPNKFNVEKDLFSLGNIVRRDVIKRIKSGIGPPLKAATIRRKGGESTPLVDTGLLVGSIRSVVVMK